MISLLTELGVAQTTMALTVDQGLDSIGILGGFGNSRTDFRVRVTQFIGLGAANGAADAGEVAELVFMNEDEGVLTAEAKKVVANCISEVGRVQVDLVWLTHHVA